MVRTTTTDERWGPYVRWCDGKIVCDTTPGIGGSHGRQHEFGVEARQPEHPIVRGLPHGWMHAKDELYAHMRGAEWAATVTVTLTDVPDDFPDETTVRIRR